MPADPNRVYRERRVATSVTLGLAVLLGLVFSIAVEERSGVFIYLLPLSGLVSASALLVMGRHRNGVLAGLILGSASALGFITGGISVGTVIAAALLVACFTPTLRSFLPREDDNFFVLSALFWLILGFLCLMLWGLGGETIQNDMRQGWSVVKADLSQIIGTAAEMTTVGQADVTRNYVQQHPLSIALAILLPIQALVSYLALRWARGRMGWVDPVFGGIIFFRVHIRYSLLVITALALLVLAYGTEAGWAMAAGLPLLAWMGAGCFLSGFSTLRFMAMRYHLLGKARTARVLTIFALIMVFFAHEVVAFIGLIDIWFDLRKLTLIRKGEK